MPTLAELARLTGGRVEGDGEWRVERLRPVDEAGEGDLAFLTSAKYAARAGACPARAFLADEKTALPGRHCLRHPDPYFALSILIRRFHPEPDDPPEAGPVAASAVVPPSARVHPGAVVGPRTVLGERVTVHSGAVIMRDAAVGDDTVVFPNAVLYPRVRVGRRCVIHGGAVLGADGFGFAFHEGRYHKIPQVGGVVLGDDVEIGANACVDAGTLSPTTIGDGTKIDDLVMIAHNVRVGRHSVLVGQVGIAGSTVIGERAVFAGQSGAVGHITIGDRVTVTAKTGVAKDTPDGAMVSGFPGRDHRVWLKEQAALARLPEFIHKLRKGEPE
jgi:UDP-3-O-[3-hydroxymyristoyl] glucosamine N-acyltransferase